MLCEMRLFEDLLSDGEEARFDDALPRALYVVAGSVSANGRELPADDGAVLEEPLRLCAGAGGACLWRWEVAASGAAPAARSHRAALRLVRRFDPAAISEELLLRLDSVAFPPGGAALLHTHRGPGIRCLREGDIRIETEGRASSYGPGGPWFESGPEPVFAQASFEVPSRFIRAMVLPRALLGASSIRYVREEDRDKPKSQSYRVFAEMPITLGAA